MQFPVDALQISEVACDLRNNHTPTNASETCLNQLAAGSSTPLDLYKCIYDVHICRFLSPRRLCWTATLQSEEREKKALN